MKHFAIIAFVVIATTFGFHSLALATPPEFQATVTSTLSSTPSASLTMTPTRRITSTLTVTATLARTPTRTITTTATITATETLSTTATPTATATLTATIDLSATTPTATPTVTPTPTATPFRYPLTLDPQALSIDALRARPYGGGAIKITRVLSDGQTYKQVLIEYTSDGLRITGMMNIPHGIGPFPVVVLDHGYFPPAQYKSGDGTNPSADVFARNGYLTIASDYRCYGGSQCGSNPFDIGYAIDVLNLIADLPSLSYADTTHVGIWGHSMGGGVTMRVLAINQTIKVGSLYGAVSSDDEVHYCWLAGCTTALVTPVPRTNYKLELFDQDFSQSLPPPGADTPLDYRAKLHAIFLKSSPSRFLANINAPIIIHHGEADDTVPIQWSVDLADRLTALNKLATLYTYPGENHVFVGWGWQLFMTRTLAFFDDYLNPRSTPITVTQRVLQQERIAAEESY